MRFKNKVAIVTGGSSGIGKETAKRLVAEGASVVLSGEDEGKLQAAAKEIGGDGKVRFLSGDIGKPATGAALVKTAEQDFGGLDLLVSNAGIFQPKPFTDITEDDYDRFLKTILKGKFFVAQAAAKAMKKRGGGAIVHTGSMWALQAIGATPSSAYSAANAGVHALVHNLALELAPDKIRINAVAPAVGGDANLLNLSSRRSGAEGAANVQRISSAGTDWATGRRCRSDIVSAVGPELLDHGNCPAGGWWSHGRA